MTESTPHEFLARLRARAEAATDVLSDATVELDQQRAAFERRRARLLSAGLLDPEAVEAALASPVRCPRVEAHSGSCAAAQGIEAWLDPGSPTGRARTLLLLGPTGRGKSYAATWALAEQQGSWLAATECRVDGWDDLRPKAATSRLLVLDDLGREPTGWAARELADVLELRHNRGLRTVVTSNLTADRLAERYGERLASRWADDRLTVTVEVLGRDLRVRGAK